MADEDTPKIHIDSDWKAEAQAEKERLSNQVESDTAAPGRGSGAGKMPEANFETLVSTMATQALFSMGAIPDPRTGQRVAHLDLARHHIDMLGVIEEKTKGNLTEEEQKMLSTTVYELRNTYIQVSNASRNA
jgi:hypothetical protein